MSEQEDEELDTILKLFDEKKTTAVFNAIDFALSKVVSDLKPSPYEVEIAMKLIDLKLKDLETRSAIADVQETYIPSEESQDNEKMYK